MKYDLKKATLLAAGFLALGTLSTTLADDATPAAAPAATTAAAPAADSGSIDFKTAVLPILKNSCFACHVSGTQVTLPTDPELAQKAQNAMNHATQKFAMGESFPFPNDEPAAKQLSHLQKSVSKGFMPPKSQTKLGLGSPLSDQDRKTLLAWVAQVQAAQK